MVDPALIEKIFGKDKKIDDLCPFVQDLLAKTAPGGSVNTEFFNMLKTLHQLNLSQGATMVGIKDRGYKIKKVDIRKFNPTPEDVMIYFAHLARGFQYVSDHYGENLRIDNVKPVPPGHTREHNMGLRTLSYDNGSEIRELLVSPIHIYLSKGHRTEKTQNPYGDGDVPSRKRLGYFTMDALITAHGIEEGDHAYWRNNPDKFQQEFGEPLKIRPISSQEYDDDPLEKNATKMIAQAIKPLSLAVRQVS